MQQVDFQSLREEHREARRAPLLYDLPVPLDLEPKPLESEAEALLGRVAVAFCCATEYWLHMGLNEIDAEDLAEISVRMLFRLN